MTISPLQQTIAELGEQQALKFGLAPLNRGTSSIVSTGDDAAVLPVADGRFVITTDTMFQDQDFRLDWSTPHDLGWKAIASNASDVAAMGAEALGFTIALGIPSSFTGAWLYEFATGLQAAIDELCPQAEVVGGDLAAASSVVIAVTATGQLHGREPVLRSTAQAGDVLAVAGTLGKAAAGLSLLQRGSKELTQAYKDLVAVQLRPQPPLILGPSAADSGATAMLDISDGLLLDASRIANASQVTLELDANQLEGFVAVLELAAQSLETPEAAQEWVLRGGEDHGLLATFPPNTTLPRGFKPIGRVTAEPEGQTHPVRLMRNGVDLLKQRSVGDLGWDSVRLS
jgi:thiamine-monophosphate kinase